MTTEWINECVCEKNVMKIERWLRGHVDLGSMNLSLWFGGF